MKEELKTDYIKRMEKVYENQFTKEEYDKLFNIVLELEKIVNYYPIEEIIDIMRNTR